jgi:two-component system, NarL family, response regulator LiaR
MHIDSSDTVPGPRRLHRPTAVLPVDVVVATRPALVRDVMSRALGVRLNLRVVALPSDMDTADCLRKLQPRILIVDDGDSTTTWEAVIRRMHQASPSTRIIVVTARCHEDFLRRLARTGAYTVVPESSDLGILLRAVESASAGRECEARFDVQSSNVFRGKATTPDRDRCLTPREWEVAELVAKGLRNKVIALRLNISVDTVKSHLNNTFRKLELDGRLALGILARSRLGPKTDM